MKYLAENDSLMARLLFVAGDIDNDKNLDCESMWYGLFQLLDSTIHTTPLGFSILHIVRIFKNSAGHHVIHQYAIYLSTNSVLLSQAK